MSNYRRNTLAASAFDPPSSLNQIVKKSSNHHPLSSDDNSGSHHQRFSLALISSSSSLKPPNAYSSLPPVTPVHPNHPSSQNQPPPSASNRMYLGPARSLRTPVAAAPQSHPSHGSNVEQHGSRGSTPAPPSNPVQTMTKEMSTLTVAPSSSRHFVVPPRHSLAPLSTTRSSLAPQSSQLVSNTLVGRSSLSARRSSTHAKLSLSAGLTSVTAASATVIKDPRPIREKSFQYAAIKNLIKFLAENAYDRPISPKILSSPSAKDFQAIFKFLYACLDPCFNWNEKKFEEEVPGLMKGLRYPFANDISKSHLYAVGSMHAWPSLLAMLHWMVELIQCCDQINAMNTFEVESTHQPPNLEIPQPEIAKEGDAEAEKMFFDYLTKSYKMFLSGDDNYETMQQDLAANFEKKNEYSHKDVEILEDQIKKMENELNTLTKNDSPLVIIEREKSALLVDIDKFKKFIKHQEAKKGKLNQTLRGLEEELCQLNKEVTHEEELKREYHVTIDAQSIHPEDVDRMRSEKELLTKSLDQLRQLKENLSKSLHEKEKERDERLQDIDKLLQEYRVLSEKLSLVPSTAKNAHGKNFDLHLESLTSTQDDETKENLSHNGRPSLPLINTKWNILSLDLKSTVAPIVLGLRDSMQATFNELSDQIHLAQEQIDHLTEWCSDNLEEVDQLEERIKKLTIQYTSDKEKLTFENKRSAEEIESLENELQKMKSDIASAFLASQQQLQKIAIEHDHISRRATDEKEKIAKETFRLLENLINLKTHIETQLGGFEDWIDSQDADSVYMNGSTMVKGLF